MGKIVRRLKNKDFLKSACSLKHLLKTINMSYSSLMAIYKNELVNLD